MHRITRTTADNPDFNLLIVHLDEYLSVINGETDNFFKQFNHVDMEMQVVILYLDNIAVACGAFKPINKQLIEIKRMFVLPSFRKKGLASIVLKALENWASELGYTQARLETAKSMTSAVLLYEKNGYHQIANYDQYIAVDTSVCFGKSLKY